MFSLSPLLLPAFPLHCHCPCVCLQDIAPTDQAAINKGTNKNNNNNINNNNILLKWYDWMILGMKAKRMNKWMKYCDLATEITWLNVKGSPAVHTWNDAREGREGEEFIDTSRSSALLQETVQDFPQKSSWYLR